MNGFLSVFSMLSRIPLKRKIRFDPGLYGFWAPSIGLLISLLLYCLYLLLSLFNMPVLILVLLILPLQYLLFNLFHFDGLVDTGDAFLSFTDKQKKHEILKDSRVGAFGLYMGIIYLISKYALFHGLLAGFSGQSLLIFFYPIVGRMVSTIIPTIMPAAKKEGLGARLRNMSTAGMIFGLLTYSSLFFLLLLFAELSCWSFVACCVVYAVSIFFSLLVSCGLYRSIDGYTGDALGFSIELGELVYMLSLYLVLSLFLQRNP